MFIKIMIEQQIITEIAIDADNYVMKIKNEYSIEYI